MAFGYQRSGTGACAELFINWLVFHFFFLSRWKRGWQGLGFQVVLWERGATLRRGSFVTWAFAWNSRYVLQGSTLMFDGWQRRSRTRCSCLRIYLRFRTWRLKRGTVFDSCCCLNCKHPKKVKIFHGEDAQILFRV